MLGGLGDQIGFLRGAQQGFDTLTQGLSDGLGALESAAGTVAEYTASASSSAAAVNASAQQLAGSLAQAGSGGGKTIFKGKVTGQYNYGFSFYLEGRGFDQTGTVVATAVSRHDRNVPVALTCRWKRRIGDSVLDIPGIQSNMYQISADDIGTSVIVEAQPAERGEEWCGVALGEIGPFELDAGTRRSLDNALGAGGTRYPVAYHLSDVDEKKIDTTLHISPEFIKFCPPPGRTDCGPVETMDSYTADYPKVIIHPLNTVRFKLILDQDRQYHLSSVSRTQRDLIALTVRVFHARVQMTTTALLRSLFVNPATPGTPASAQEAARLGQIDMQIKLQRFNGELNRALCTSEVLERILQQSCKEKNQLDSELQSTIESYTEVVNALEEQLHDAVEGNAPAVAASSTISDANYEILLGEKNKLQAELNEALSRGGSSKQNDEQLNNLYRQVAFLRDENSSLVAAKTSNESGHAKLQAEIDRLKKEAEQNAQEQHKRSTTEFKRLRKEIEQQKDQKEELSNAFASATAERDALRVEQGVRQSAEKTEAEMEELQSRYALLQSELAKTKSEYEFGVERIQAVNARLLDEKSDMESKVQQAEEKILEQEKKLAEQQDSIDTLLEQKLLEHKLAEQQLAEKLLAEKNKVEKDDNYELENQSEPDPFADPPPKEEKTSKSEDGDEEKEFSAEDDRDEIISDLRNQIAEKDELIDDLEGEVESLQKRIRKMCIPATQQQTAVGT